MAPDRILAAHFKDNDPTSGIITRTMPYVPIPKKRCLEVATSMMGRIGAVRVTCRMTKGRAREAEPAA